MKIKIKMKHTRYITAILLALLLTATGTTAVLAASRSLEAGEAGDGTSEDYKDLIEGKGDSGTTPSPTPTPTPAELPFEDIRKDTNRNWYYDAVVRLNTMGLMTGMNETYYGAYEEISRAQFAVILYRMEGKPAASYHNEFPDVKENPGTGWYTSAVAWASKNKLITGYTHNGHFGAADPITREQLATILYRYAKWKGYDLGEGTDLSNYKDASRVSPFAAEALSWTVTNGIITGKDNGTRLAPQETTKRVECAVILNRFLNLEQPSDSDDETGGDLESDPDSDSKPSTETGPETDSKPGTETGPETDSKPGTETGPDSDSKPGTESGTDSDSKPDTETGTESGSESGTETHKHNYTQTSSDLMYRYLSCKCGKSYKEYNDQEYTIDLGNGNTTTVVGHYDLEMANRIGELVNEKRVNIGKNPFTISSLNSNANNAALIRAREIKIQYSHTRPNGENGVVSFASYAAIRAENVGKGDSTADAFFDGFENSSLHAIQHISSQYANISIAVFASRRNSGGYYYYCVELFG